MNSVHHVLIHDISVSCIACVAACDVPVDIGVAFFLRFLRKSGHDTLAVIGADRVGTSAGEAEEVCPAACLRLDDVLHLAEVLPVCFRACVDLGIVMGGRVDGNYMSGFVLGFDQVLIIGVGRCDEERRAHLVLLQDLKQFFRVRSGSIVKSQIDDLVRVQLFGNVRLTLHCNIAGCLRHIAPFIGNFVGYRICACLVGVDGSALFNPLGDVTVRVILCQNIIFPGLALEDETFFSGGKVENRCVAVIVEDLALCGRGIARKVRDGVVDDAVSLFTLNFGGNISVVIIGGGKAFLHVFVMREGVVIIDMLKFDHRGRRIDDLDGSCAGRAHPQILGCICDGVCSGFVNIDVLGGNRDRDRMVDEIQYGSGDLRFGAVILVRRSAFADNG